MFFDLLAVGLLNDVFFFILVFEALLPAIGFVVGVQGVLVIDILPFVVIHVISSVRVDFVLSGLAFKCFVLAGILMRGYYWRSRYI